MYRDALPHSACHKERFLLIFSVPHAVLDDKMATAAIHVVLMWKPDARSFFIYCRRAAWRVQRNHLLQPWERKTADHLQPHRRTGILQLQHSLQGHILNDYTSGLIPCILLQNIAYIQSFWIDSPPSGEPLVSIGFKFENQLADLNLASVGNW